MLKLQFLVVGVAFAAVKTSIYVIVGLVTEDARAHASVTSTFEGIFTLGVLSSFWLFSLFIDPKAPRSMGVASRLSLAGWRREFGGAHRGAVSAR